MHICDDMKMDATFPGDTRYDGLADVLYVTAVFRARCSPR